MDGFRRIIIIREEERIKGELTRRQYFANKLPEKLKSVVGMTDKYSLEIYSLQYYTICSIMPTVWQNVMKRISGNVLTRKMPLYHFIITPIVIIIASVVILLVIKGIRKNELVRKIAFDR